jgi:large subunit ribosomal protein L22
MRALKTNERPPIGRGGRAARRAATEARGTRAVARYVRISPYKVRAVLDLIRGCDVESAQEILRFAERDAAAVVAKTLASAVANAEHNDQVLADELFVSAAFADEGPTLKRWRPRARGRATRIRKRTCHVTVVVSRMSEEELSRHRARATPASRRARRAGQEVAEQRRRLGRRRRDEPIAAEVEEEAEADEAAELGELEPVDEIEGVAAAEPELAEEPPAVQEQAAAEIAEASADAGDEVPAPGAPDEREEQ